MPVHVFRNRPRYTRPGASLAHIERQYFLFSPITGWVMRDIALSAENYHDLERYSVAVSEGIVLHCY